MGVLHFGPARDKIKATNKPRKFNLCKFFKAAVRNAPHSLQNNNFRLGVLHFGPARDKLKAT